MPRPDDNGYLENALRRSLARPAVPDGFEGRVMERVRSDRSPSAEGAGAARGRFRWPFRPWAAWAFAAGACAAVILALVIVPQWHQRRQTDLAMERTAEKELAETLQLAGYEWNRAQNAAFAPREDTPND